MPTSTPLTSKKMTMLRRMAGMDGMDHMSSSPMSMKAYFHGSLGDALWFKTWAPSTSGAVVGACIALMFLAIIERFLAAARAGLEESWKLQTRRLLTSFDSISTDSSHNNSLLQPHTSFHSSLLTPSSGHPNVQTLASSSSPNLGDSGEERKEVGEEPVRDRHASRPPPVITLLDVRPSRRERWAPPFVWRVDLMRGALHMVQSGIRYLLMLAVMSFNIYFFLCILLGSCLGEVLFGRFAAHTGEQSH